MDHMQRTITRESARESNTALPISRWVMSPIQMEFGTRANNVSHSEINRLERLEQKAQTWSDASSRLQSDTTALFSPRGVLLLEGMIAPDTLQPWAEGVRHASTIPAAGLEPLTSCMPWT